MVVILPASSVLDLKVPNLVLIILLAVKLQLPSISPVVVLAPVFNVVDFNVPDVTSHVLLVPTFQLPTISPTASTPPVVISSTFIVPTEASNVPVRVVTTLLVVVPLAVRKLIPPGVVKFNCVGVVASKLRLATLEFPIFKLVAVTIPVALLLTKLLTAPLSLIAVILYE